MRKKRRHHAKNSPRMQKNLSKEQERSFKGVGAVAANIFFLNLHKKVKYYGVIKVRKLTVKLN